MIKAVIFDLDNTLYEYEPCNVIGMKNMHDCLRKILGKDITDDSFNEILNNAKKEVKNNLSGMAASHNRVLYAQYICENLNAFTAKNVLSLYNAYWDAFIDSMVSYEGVSELIFQLKKKDIKVGICSDLTTLIQMRKLIKLELADLFDCVVTSEESGAEKPMENSFRLVLRKLNVNHENAIMVGDDYEKDILGATALGIDAIQIGKNCRWNRCVSNFKQLESLLEDIIGC